MSDLQLVDFPPSPMDEYRKRASFDWKRLKVVMDGEERIRYENEIYGILANDPVFEKPTVTPGFEEYRALTFKRLLRLHEYGLVFNDEVFTGRWKHEVLAQCLLAYDNSLGIKWYLNGVVARHALQLLGTERHAPLLDALKQFKIFCCFAMTELSHGSNTKNMRTEARYDPRSQQFVIHTPDWESAKAMIGNLGKTATHAVVPAQLYTPDGQCHGLHAFVVPIRCPRTMRPFPGVIVGDMGDKIGQNGLDNGFVTFDHYRIPRENLLNRGGDVTPDGEYVSPHKGANKRVATGLRGLTAGRVGITGQATQVLRVTMPIVVRYSAMRKQFSPSRDVDSAASLTVGSSDNNNNDPEADREWAVLEYPMQQWRILPYLAATYAFMHFAKKFHSHFVDYTQMFASERGERSPELEAWDREVHAISSACKPLTTWTAQRAIQESREACGGHGYLKSSRLGALRDDSDPSQTYEGDNNLLLQQTANYLLGVVKDGNRAQLKSPMGSIDFLQNREEILRKKASVHPGKSDVSNSVLEAYRWLVCHLLNASKAKIQADIKRGVNSFVARGEAQVYLCHTMAMAFIETTVLDWFARYISSNEVPHDMKPILRRLCDLYGAWSLDKHLAALYIGGYCQGPEFGSWLRQSIVRLCSELKDDAVALVDVIAPPDFVLGSALGRSDGNIYKNIMAAVFETPNVLSRSTYWADFVNKPAAGSLKKSKL